MDLRGEYIEYTYFFNFVDCCFLYKAKDLSAPLVHRHREQSDCLSLVTKVKWGTQRGRQQGDLMSLKIMGDTQTDEHTHADTQTQTYTQIDSKVIS
jgi:hypothetical protein